MLLKGLLCVCCESSIEIEYSRFFPISAIKWTITSKVPTLPMKRCSLYKGCTLNYQTHIVGFISHVLCCFIHTLTNQKGILSCCVEQITHRSSAGVIFGNMLHYFIRNFRFTVYSYSSHLKQNALSTRNSVAKQPK
jgi:hypothetical protein